MTAAGSTTPRGHRRGNALILVAGVLVLLVIMATVFLSRTGTLRELGTAQRQGAFHRDRMESAASDIAQEVADSLFVRPIDYTLIEFVKGVPPEEARRKTPEASSGRYEVDPQFSWNRAPHEVIPWTNPPDWLTWPLRAGPLPERADDADLDPLADLTAWQWGEYRPSGASLDLFTWPDAGEVWPPVTQPYDNVVMQPRENPLGGPGVSDTRWLRDIEPQRMGVRTLADPTNPNSADINPFLDRHADAFSHWRHMSWIGRPGNGWRMCPDIADVTGVRSNIDVDGQRYSADTTGQPAVWADGRPYYGGVYQRSDVPVEQWPAMMPTEFAGGFNGGELARLTDDDILVEGDSATSVFLPPNDDVEVLEGLQDASVPAWDPDVSIDFWDRWLTWLRPEGYKAALVAARNGNGNLLPPNFYDLDDLDGDGVRGEYYDPASFPDHPDYDPTAPAQLGEAPLDEFRPGAARWHVSRILTDTDGDGFTDSFWWLSPHVGVDGTRQVVGVSVTDNAGRVNANVATRFVKSDSPGALEGTRGWTPADVALVSQNFAPAGDDAYAPAAAPVWNTGFFDIEAHQPALLETTWDMSQDLHPDLIYPFVTYPEDGGGSGQGWSEAYQHWNSNYWRATSNRAFLEAINVDSGGGNPNPFFPDVYPHDISDRDNRLFYFRQSGQDPQHPENIFTPFNLADELELRAYEGNNHGWISSRLERSLGPSGAYLNGEPHVLRGNLNRMESGEADEQLDNRQLAHDLRHRLTLFNGARNETMPAHLWWSHRAPMPRADDIVVGGDLPGSGLTPNFDVRVEDMHERFDGQTRGKIDLRAWERPARGLPSMNTEYDPPTFSDRLAQGLLLGLTSGDVTDRDPGGNVVDPTTGFDYVHGETGRTIPLRGGRDSYFGEGDEAWEQTRRAAAAMAANMLAARDPDQEQPLLSEADILAGAPTPHEYHGVIGAVPLPFFEGAYYPDDLDAHTDSNNPGDIVFPGAETISAGGSTDADQLRNDLSFGNGSGNLVTDHVDLSDISRPPSANAGMLVGQMEPWEIVCVAIDLNGDGLAEYVEQRPWAAAEGAEVVGVMRSLAGSTDCPEIEDACKTACGLPQNQQANYFNGVRSAADDPTCECAKDAYPLYSTADPYEPVPQWSKVYAPEVHMLGMEPQPFISEVFFAEVARPWMFPDELICQNDDCQQKWSWYWVGNYQNETELATPGGVIEGPDMPVVPRVMLAVQLVNPYQHAIPLMRRRDGVLKPIYKLRLMNQDRSGGGEAPTWEIPLDPTANGPLRTAQAFDDPGVQGGIDIAEQVPSFAVDPTADPIPMLPPATNDAPYSLMIVLNGMELAPWRGAEHTDASGNDRPSEVVQWLDFLDAEPRRHPAWHQVLDPEASFANGADTFRQIEPGELIWRIDPARLEDIGIEQDELTSASAWYDAAVAGGGVFNGPSIDPTLGAAVELVRTYGSPFPGSYTPDSAAIVVDRTVGQNGVDELSHVIGTQMAMHALPPTTAISQATAGTGFLQLQMQAPSYDTAGGTPPGTVAATFNMGYPKSLQRRHRKDPWDTDGDGDVEESEMLVVDALDSSGVSSLAHLESQGEDQWGALAVDPWDARWMQWGRYSRAWAVDDVDVSRDIQYPPVPEADGPDLDDLGEADRRLWRADRAAPRFVAGVGRVTKSWSPQWANELGLMPDAQVTAGQPGNYIPPEGQSWDVDAWPPLVSAKDWGGADIDHVYSASHQPGWEAVNSSALFADIHAGYPLLVDENLPHLGP
ncbi:MAG: hypothetical protein QF733_08580, partial [Phycisphaerales bacterium]|nr:hypothetical protein [Phycisphaerales bacterium]